MHELSVVQNIIKIIDEKFHDGNYSITEVVMEIGELTCVEHQTLSFCFNSVKQNTILKDAIFSINTIKGKGMCRFCGHEQCTVCEKCEKTGMEIIQGKELQLQYVEVNKHV